MDLLAFQSRFELFAFEWNSKFEDDEGISARFYMVEDRILVEEIGVFVNSTPLTTQLVVERFLDYDCDGDRDRYLYRDTQVKDFLGDLNLEDLYTGIIPEVKVPLVLFDERRDYVNSSEPTFHHQESFRRTFCAQDFYKVLRNSRYCPPQQNRQLSADRRTVYVADADPYCVLALLATVCPLQTMILRDFIWRHLIFHAFIGVRLARGYKTFALELHLPYYAWRPSEQGSSTETQLSTTSKSHRIRKSQTVKYLHKSQSQHLETSEQEHIFEAQISFLVTGINNRFWTAYSFADVYFKDAACTETADYYHQASEDPHSGGKDSADQVIWDAREFFLRILACRMEQVREEWNNVISQLFKHIEPYEDKIFSDDPQTSSSQNYDMTQDESYKWTIRILRKYASHLSKTISSWETFRDGEIRYFFRPNSNILAEPRYGVSLASVNRDVQELIALRKSLLHQTEIFENMTNSMATHAALAENRTLRRQSDFIQALTVITIFYLPLNLASSIYSMQSSVLPELVHLADYFYTLIGLTVATLILVINLPHFMKTWQTVYRLNNKLWYRLAGKSKMSLDWASRRKRPSNSIDDQDLEMQIIDGADVVSLAEDRPVRRSTL